MCKKSKIEKLSEQVLNRIDNVTRSSIEKYTAIKVLQKQLDNFLKDEDFQKTVNKEYENLYKIAEKNDLKVVIMECSTKTNTPRKNWKYSKELQCKMEDIKAEQNKEQINGKATFTLSNVNYTFTVITE